MDNMFLDEDGIDLSIDLTPMIDVLFMLLIFFITAMTFAKPVIDVNLATAESAAQGSGSGKQLVISIDKTGQIFLDGEQVDLIDLESVFVRGHDSTINLFVDRETPFQDFLSVIDLAKLNNCDDLLVTTEPAAQ